MIWDIKKCIGELIELQTEYTKLNFYIEPEFDYDNIKFNHKLLTNKSFIKIHWTDISANINDVNEGKINRYFKDLGVLNTVLYDKHRIYTDISDTALLTENIDINNKSVQQKIFSDYLTLNGYDEKFIKEILEIDDIIESRIESKINNIQSNWKIDKFWLDNFKSYKNIDIDWSDMNGIIQLYSAENQQGKTTILDGITYITHGTTLSTNKLGGAKTEKHGDQRYINNKRDLDYCSGGMIIDINNIKYAILRRTDREWNKSKTKVSSAKTVVEYYKDGIIDDEHKYVGEQRTETQNMLNELFVDFNDFIRLTLINSFNINELIAMDRATFIDSIITDAGYDVFEKKLDVFKEYKKTLKVNRIDFDLDSYEDIVLEYKKQIKIKKDEYLLLKEELSELNKRNTQIMQDRDKEYRKFNKIDDEILNINIDEIKSNIIEYDEKMKDNEIKLKEYNTKMIGLKTTYDKEMYENLLKDIKTIEDNILNYKLRKSQLENENEKILLKIENNKNNISQLVENKIKDLENDISYIEIDIEKLNNNFEIRVKEEIKKYEDDIKDYQYDIKEYKSELLNIKNQGVSIKKEIKELDESKICPTCFRPFEDDSHLEHIENKKKELEQKIKDLMIIVREKQNNIKDKELSISDVNDIIENIKLGVYDEEILLYRQQILSEIDKKTNDIEEIEVIIKKLKNNNLDEIKEDLEKLNDYNKRLHDKEKENKELLKDIISELKKINIEKDNVEKETQKLKNEKDEVDRYNSLLLSKNNIEIIIEKIKNTLKTLNNKVEKYNESIIFIEQNKLINEKINEYDNILGAILIEKENNLENSNSIINDTKEIKEKLKLIREKFDVFKRQQKQDELHKVYQKCVHRDGLPFYLLMKSRDIINQELSELLSTVNFNIFFDEKMKLKMFMEKHKNVVQNVLEGSGAEKSFSAIALKLALRTINNNSRPNFLMLDEVTGNLKGKSIENFNIMLEIMKERIDKIIIIEQNHPIDYDYGIVVEKDEKTEISSLKIEK
jgi:exonuclease SbcC